MMEIEEVGKVARGSYKGDPTNNSTLLVRCTASVSGADYAGQMVYLCQIERQ